MIRKLFSTSQRSFRLHLYGLSCADPDDESCKPVQNVGNNLTVETASLLWLSGLSPVSYRDGLHTRPVHVGFLVEWNSEKFFFR
jgi:hypothetical protein